MQFPWNTQRHRNINGHRQGTLRIGTIFYIQDNVRPFNQTPDPPRLCNPWIILAFKNDTCQNKTLARTHLVTVKSLRNGQTKDIAYWILERMNDEGFAKGN